MSAIARNDRLLDEFCDTLWLEDGLSQNTLQSYRRDLRQFGAWLERSVGKRLLTADHADIQSYLGYRFARKSRAVGCSTYCTRSNPCGVRSRRLRSNSTRESTC